LAGTFAPRGDLEPSMLEVTEGHCVRAFEKPPAQPPLAAAPAA
jgi:hypothetical protein